MVQQTIRTFKDCWDFGSCCIRKNKGHLIVICSVISGADWAPGKCIIKLCVFYSYCKCIKAITLEYLRVFESWWCQSAQLDICSLSTLYTFVKCQCPRWGDTASHDNAITVQKWIIHNIQGHFQDKFMDASYRRTHLHPTRITWSSQF